MLLTNRRDHIFSEAPSLEPHLNFEKYKENENENFNPYNILKGIRVANINRLVIGQLNINSLRNKFEALKAIIKGNLDILIITESKLNDSFPINDFIIDGCSPPFRADRNKNGEGVIIYVRKDIPCRELKEHPPPPPPPIFEGIFLEINLKRSKWLLFGGYNPSEDNILNFINQLGSILDLYMSRYENLLLLGDFNSEMSENGMRDFSETYDLKKLIKEPTCFKSIENPTLIDLILTNKWRSYQNSTVIETGLSDYRKLTITVMRCFFQKQSPITISYRDYKNFN